MPLPHLSLVPTLKLFPCALKPWVVSSGNARVPVASGECGEKQRATIRTPAATPVDSDRDDEKDDADRDRDDRAPQSGEEKQRGERDCGDESRVEHALIIGHAAGGTGVLAPDSVARW